MNSSLNHESVMVKTTQIEHFTVHTSIPGTCDEFSGILVYGPSSEEEERGNVVCIAALAEGKIIKWTLDRDCRLRTNLLFFSPFQSKDFKGPVCNMCFISEDRDVMFALHNGQLGCFWNTNDGSLLRAIVLCPDASLETYKTLRFLSSSELVPDSEKCPCLVACLRDKHSKERVCEGIVSIGAFTNRSLSMIQDYNTSEHSWSDERVTCLDCLGRHLAVGTMSGALFVLDVHSGLNDATLKPSQGHPIMQVQFTRCSKSTSYLISVLSNNGMIHIYRRLEE
mmetsp:Transcript_19823/g.32500  ORF Transcript_19823/g.32500 Transcript_19823/m.32500 type:complete len:281 (-) Transcript_19823:167-1009(-)|eukprot:CAMPEP_0184671076 /NCGR_PEP_ID=MMETSP0308-20130426/85277_1 /TAXON_ID=38269 /ORGANISM="Gloeochaete witrockiana, Strain SAG 46.84" /LENGTH=280 /DNA_ID=CAMNT_0027118125 /DNA_START=1194 /DNA_END=2036 /DNA_ORIENTATION=+